VDRRTEEAREEAIGMGEDGVSVRLGRRKGIFPFIFVYYYFPFLLLF
jgi:hypothetical protein